MAQRLTKLQSRFKAVYPSLAFIGGFLWDAVSFGRSITSLNLFLLLAYMVIAAVILIIMGRRGDPQGDLSRRPIWPGAFEDDLATADPALSAANSGWDPAPPVTRFVKLKHWARAHGLVFVLQFCYGSMFSALVIFYFMSSSEWPGFLIVSALVALLFLNEYFKSQYHRFTLTWSLFGICSILFLNFALPHLVHSIQPIWFFLSTGLGVSLVVLIRRLSPKARGSLWPTFAMAGALILLFIVNAIPPVPLVDKSLVICRSLEKTTGVYTARIEMPGPWLFWRRSESMVRQLPGEKIFCFTSVFIPMGIECTLYHSWQFQDPIKKKWVEWQRIGFPIHGGRKDGFRGYTFKRNLAPGRWLVRVETESGRVLGTVHFRAETTLDSNMVYKNLILQ